ncbi:MAG: hypothetical protein AAF725_06180 [Acidobacteriota bacterium]
MNRPRPLALLFLGALTAVGCASVPQAPRTCFGTELQTGPAWMAGAAWDGRGERLVLVDPGTRTLLVYSPEGQLLERASHELLDGLDFHHPVRVEAEGEGFIVGDRSRLLWLDSGFERARVAFDGVDGVGSLHLGDWTRPSQSTVAFADMQVDDESWTRGFFRFGRGSSYEVLAEMPLEQGGEYARYYSYGLRPYVASVGRRTYVLRYRQPSEVYRAGRSELKLLWRIDDEASRVEGSAAGQEKIFGWDGGLYLLESVKRAAENPSGLEAPQPVGPAEGGTDSLVLDPKAAPSKAAQEALRAALLSGQVVQKTTRDWYLSRIDTRRGGREWRRRLISGLEGALTVVPGPRTWALVSHSGIAAGSLGGRTEVHWMPAESVAPGTSGEDLCPASPP